MRAVSNFAIAAMKRVACAVKPKPKPIGNTRSVGLKQILWLIVIIYKISAESLYRELDAHPT